MTADLNKYDMIPLFDGNDQIQKIEIENRDTGDKIGQIKIINKNGRYQIYTSRDDLTKDTYMGYTENKHTIGDKLAIVSRKLINC